MIRNFIQALSICTLTLTLLFTGLDRASAAGGLTNLNPVIVTGHGNIRMRSNFAGQAFPADKASIMLSTLNFMRNNQSSLLDFYTSPGGPYIRPYNHLISQIDWIYFVPVRPNTAAYTYRVRDINVHDQSPWSKRAVMASVLLHEADHQRYGSHTCGSGDVDINGPTGVGILYSAILYHRGVGLVDSFDVIDPFDRMLLFSDAASRVNNYLCGHLESKAMGYDALYSNVFPVPANSAGPSTLASANFKAGALNLRSGYNYETQFGGHQLTLQTGGNLVLSNARGSTLWESGTGGRDCFNGQCTANFQGDGNLVLYQNGQPYWASHTQGVNSSLKIMSAAPYLQITVPGDFKIWSATPNSIFKAGKMMLRAGSVTRTADVILAFQSDGNLVLYRSNYEVLWASHTNVSCTPDSCVAAFQTDGNLVLYQNGVPYWASNTIDSRLRLQIEPNYPYLSIGL